MGVDTSEKESTIAPTTKNAMPKLTNCKNCGAPLHSNRCEFCDTQAVEESGLKAKLNMVGIFGATCFLLILMQGMQKMFKRMRF